MHKAQDRKEWVKITKETKVKLKEDEREEQFNKDFSGLLTLRFGMGCFRMWQTENENIFHW
jgi:hypothetical protein